MKEVHQNYSANENLSPLTISHKREDNSRKSLGQEPFFKQSAKDAMEEGSIPDFQKLHEDLSRIEISEERKLSATDFLEALRNFEVKDQKELTKFLENPETNHVLVQNDQIKMVLIRWEKGSSSSIHGHAEKGCVFKVLQGEVEETRHSLENPDTLLSKNTYFKDSIAYIDDHIGLHRVENKSDQQAITIHLYTPGFYNAKKI